MRRLTCIQPAQPFPEAPQGLQRTLLAGRIEHFPLIQTRSQTYRFFQGIERINLITNNPADLQTKAVRAKINCCNSFVNHGRDEADKKGVRF